MNAPNAAIRTISGVDRETLFGSETTQDRMPFVLHARVISGTGGGPDKTILNSPRALQEKGYRSACLYFRDPEDQGFEVIRQRAVERNTKIVAVDDYGFLDWKIIKRTREKVLDLKPLVWHGHDYKSNLLGLLTRRFHPMKLVTTVHGWVQHTWKTPLYYAIDRRCLPRYDQVICVSRDLFLDCKKLGVAPERLSLIDNAIAVEDYSRTDTISLAKEKLGFSVDCPLVLGVGRLSKEKGFDLLIHAVSNLNRSGQKVALAIAGDGDERETLENLIKQLGAQDQIKLLGFVQDARPFYQAADLFVLSSLREGLPNVVLEAMASGTPVLTTRVAGMPTLVEDGVNGRLIPPESVEYLQSEIGELVANQPKLARFAMAALQTVQDRFDFGSRMGKVVSVYEQLNIDAPTEQCDPLPAIDELVNEIQTDIDFDCKIQFETQRWNGRLPDVNIAPEDTKLPQLQSHHAAWLNAIANGLGHETHIVQAKAGGKVVGLLPLCLVAGPIFGKFLASLPYVNTGGVWARDERVARGLIDAACELADRLDVKHLELRHEIPVTHEKFNLVRTDKVHLRLPLPESAEQLLAGFKSKLRNQIKKSNEHGLSVEFGGTKLIKEFHHVFATNMRDLGTPVFSKNLFATILGSFDQDSELCVVRKDSKPVAGGLLVHVNGVTEVPSASCIREFNRLNANMFLYWHLLTRAIERSSHTFDFGRSSKESGTFRFKKQWGAETFPSVWQYYVRHGNPENLRADAGGKRHLVKIWKRLPLSLTKIAGPPIVRGIP